jgi:hypothetical protein
MVKNTDRKVKFYTMGNFNIIAKEPIKVGSNKQTEMIFTRNDKTPLTRKNIETIYDSLKEKYGTNHMKSSILPYAGNWHTIKPPDRNKDLTWDNEDNYYDEIVKQVKSDKKYISQKEFDLHKDLIKKHATEIFATSFIVWQKEEPKSMFKKKTK